MLNKANLSTIQKSLQLITEGALSDEIMSLGEKSTDPNQARLVTASVQVQGAINLIGKVLETLE